MCFPVINGSKYALYNISIIYLLQQNCWVSLLRVYTCWVCYMFRGLYSHYLVKDTGVIPFVIYHAMSSNLTCDCFLLFFFYVVKLYSASLLNVCGSILVHALNATNEHKVFTLKFSTHMYSCESQTSLYRQTDSLIIDSESKNGRNYSKCL
jgi:hypothetical protein